MNYCRYRKVDMKYLQKDFTLELKEKINNNEVALRDLIEKLLKMGRCKAIVKDLIIEDGLLLTDMVLTFRGQA